MPDLDGEGCLVGQDMDNGSRKVELKTLTVGKVPASEEVFAALRSASRVSQRRISLFCEHSFQDTSGGRPAGRPFGGV